MGAPERLACTNQGRPETSRQVQESPRARSSGGLAHLVEQDFLTGCSTAAASRSGAGDQVGSRSLERAFLIDLDHFKDVKTGSVIKTATTCSRLFGACGPDRRRGWHGWGVRVRGRPARWSRAAERVEDGIGRRYVARRRAGRTQIRYGERRRCVVDGLTNVESLARTWR